MLRKIDSVIRVIYGMTPEARILSVFSESMTDMLSLTKQIDAAGAAKDFATADRIRKELTDAGYEVLTTKAGTTARKKLV